MATAGALLLAHADAIADRLAQAGAQIAELAAAERDTLRVGAFPSALATVIPAALATLREQRPELEVEALEASGDELGTMVASGVLHAAMCFQDAAAPPRRPARRGCRRRAATSSTGRAWRPASSRGSRS